MGGVTINSINYFYLYSAIKKVYISDYTNICKIHKLVVPNTMSDRDKLYAYIGNSHQSINESEDCYVIKYNDEVVGFYTLISFDNIVTLLNGFHISPAYRTKEVLSAFWNSVYANSKKQIVTAIWEKNEKTLQHLFRNGFHIPSNIGEAKTYSSEYDKFFNVLKKDNN